MSKAFLYSYPRSGNTWVRYIIEVLTGRTTASYDDDPLRPVNQRLSDPPIIHKRHGHKNFEEEGVDFDSTKDRMILIVRDYKEAIIRHKRQQAKNPETLYRLVVEDLQTDGLYIKLLNRYTNWKNKKRLLVYYEDLIASNPELTIKNILQFLDMYNPKKLDLFMKHFTQHREISRNYYHSMNSSMSKGQEVFHRTLLSPESLAKLDDLAYQNSGDCYPLIQRYRSNQ